MSIGNSGRIVIEVDPGAKRRLYAALAQEGLTLKDWFLRNAENYVADISQIPLSFSQENLGAEAAEKADPKKSSLPEGKV